MSEIKEQTIQDITLIVPEDDEDYLRCAMYVKMRELVEKKTKVDIAAHFGVHIDTLDRWIMKWSASGLLQRVRSMLFAALVAEEIEQANDMVSREWHSIMQRQVKTATSGKSDKNALDAAIWLHEQFIKPRMDSLEGDGKAELDYIAALDGNAFDPLAIGEIEDAEFEEKIED